MKGTRLKVHALLNSLASNLAGPFVGYNETASGASNLLIGYVQAISTLASSVAQLLGGGVADRFGKRILMATLFSVFVGALWVGTAGISDNLALAVSWTAITLGLGFYQAGWTAFLGEASEGEGRGSFLSTFARLSGIGALAGLLVATPIAAVDNKYVILDLLSGAVFLASAFVLKGQREQTVEKGEMTAPGVSRLRLYYGVTAVYGLFWGFAWPLFTITTVKIVNMTLLEFAVSQVIAVASTIAFQPLVGRLVDSDKRKWVFWGRMGLVVYPLAYMVIGAPWELYVLNVFSGFTNALLNVAFAAYLFDISPTGQRGRRGAEFNVVTGVTTMFGSLLSAYLLTLVSSGLGLWESLAILYVVSAAGRAFAALLHLRLPAGALEAAKGGRVQAPPATQVANRLLRPERP
ncbi:MAG: MFS transporter [archaeon]|nr:MAG: MFS transporter [archaeon]